MSELVVPDGITPLSGWRAWMVSADGMLLSRTGDQWPSGKALHARCPHVGELASRVIPLSRLSAYSTIGGPVASVSFGLGSHVLVYDTYESVRAHRKGFQTHGIEAVTDPVIYDEVSGEHFIPLPGDRRLVVPPPAPTAAPEPEVPSATCSCGIYCADDRRTAEAYMHGKDYILGRVALWGRVVRHDTGMRGEYAYPQVFYTDDPVMKQKLLPYGVPILSRKELPGLAKMPSSAERRKSALPNYAARRVAFAFGVFGALTAAALGWLPQLPILK